MNRSEKIAYNEGYDLSKTWNGCHNQYCIKTKLNEYLAFHKGFKDYKEERKNNLIKHIIKKSK